MPTNNTRDSRRGREGEPSSRGGSSRKSSSSNWDEIDKKREENKRKAEERANKVYPLQIKDGEEALLQFLEGPIIVETHSVKLGGKWTTEICQKVGRNRSCDMCDAGIKATWKAAFLVRDFRGSWKKETGGYQNVNKRGIVMYDPKTEAPEKLLLANNTFALSIKSESEKRGGIEHFLYSVSRTGSTAKDTNYSISRFLDPEDDDRVVPSPRYTPKASLEDAVQPLSSEALRSKGFDGSYSNQDDDDSSHSANPIRGRRGRDDDDDDDRGRRASRSGYSRSSNRGRGRDDDDDRPF